MTIYKNINDSREKAKNLFLSSLTEEQKEQFLEERRISVKGSNGGEYIIPWIIDSWETYVERVDDPNKIMCYTVFYVPYYDVLLAQKLLIETREDIFLKGCNCWRYRPEKTTMWTYLGNGYGEKKRDTA